LAFFSERLVARTVAYRDSAIAGFFPGVVFFVDRSV
jgi:hypothetical protein